MADYVSTLRADTSQHDKAMADSAKKVSDYKKETDQATSSINKMEQSTSRSTAALMKELSSMENLGRSTSNYKRQLGSLQKQIVDLTVNYNQMSEAQKQSALGQEVAQKIQELKQKASEYKDVIADVNAEVKAMASDTAGWDGMKQGLSILSSSMQTFIGLTGLSADKQEKLLKVMNNVKLAENAFNTAIQIGNALQKQSNLMTTIGNIQKKAAATATNLQTAATGKATIAQKAFNVVAKANPYVLLASAIITVVGALAAFTLGSEKAKKAEEEAQKAHEDYMASMQDSISKMGDALYQFDRLERLYKKCKTEGEKQQYLHDYADKLYDLGIEVNNVNDLEKVFCDRTQDFRQACILRAQAMGLESVQAQKASQMWEELLEARDILANADNSRINEGTAAFDILVKNGGRNGRFGTYVSRWGDDYIATNDNVLAHVENAIKARYKETFNNIEDEKDRLAGEVEDLNLGDNFHFDNNNNRRRITTTTKPDTKPDDGSLQAMKNQLSELEKQRLNINFDANPEAAAKLIKDIDELKAQIEAKEIELGIKVDPKIAEDEAARKAAEKEAEQYAKGLEKAVTSANNALKNNSNTTSAIIEPVEMFNSELETVEDTFRDNNTLLENYNNTLKDLNNSLASLRAAQEALNEAGGEDQSKWTDAARTAYADIEKRIEELTKKYEETIASAKELTITQQGLNKEIERQNRIVKKNDIYEGYKNIWNASKGWAEGLVSVADKWDEMNDGEKMGAIVESIFNTIDAFKSLYDTISIINNAFKFLSTTEQIVASVETATTAQHVANEGQKQAATATSIGLESVEAGVAATAGGASTGFPAMLIAIPLAIAAVIAAIASAKSLKANAYAEGGIITGASSIGDYNVARVNSGEMILNGSQQARLFSMINNGYSGGGRIESITKTKVDGSDLLLITKNYVKKMDKI